MKGYGLAHEGIRAKKAIGPVVFLVVLFVALLMATTATFVVHFGLFRSLDVLDAYWSVSGQRVERARVGDPVTGHVILHSRERFERDVVLRVRVDIRFWLDKDVATQRFYVVLRPGESREFELDFKPALASAGDINGYFIEVDFGFSRGKWTMPGSYPPRLIVTV